MMTSACCDAFFTKHIFIRCAWNLYFQRVTNQSHLNYVDFYNDLNLLISTTKLNDQLLIHVLYYFYLLMNNKISLSSRGAKRISNSKKLLISSDDCKTTKELYELIVILMMISNKSNDDSSYTMKTWENLTNISISLLKTKEIIILKKLNYNVFLHKNDYSNWCLQLYSICVADDLIIESISPRSNHVYNINNINIVNKFPTYNNFLMNDNYPLTPNSPIVNLSVSLKRNYQDVDSSLDYNPIKRYKQTIDETYPTPIKTLFPMINDQSSLQILPAPQFQQQPEQFQQQSQHPLDCKCCILTNLTNSYHHSMRNMVKL